MTAVTVRPFVRPSRPVNCAACGVLLRSADPAPHLCDACIDAAHEAEMRELEATARAQGFASFDAFVEHQYRASQGGEK
jgi:hypothetical protein